MAITRKLAFPPVPAQHNTNAMSSAIKIDPEKAKATMPETLVIPSVTTSFREDAESGNRKMVRLRIAKADETAREAKICVNAFIRSHFIPRDLLGSPHVHDSGSPEW